MEAVIANLLEPGDKIIVGVNGIWGERVADLAERYQGEGRGSCVVIMGERVVSCSASSTGIAVAHRHARLCCTGSKQSARMQTVAGESSTWQLAPSTGCCCWFTHVYHVKDVKGNAKLS